MKFMMFYENFKFKADYVSSGECLRQFKVRNFSSVNYCVEQQW